MERDIWKRATEYANRESLITECGEYTEQTVFQAYIDGATDEHEVLTKWIDVRTKLPDTDREVLVRCRNKNKPDGIWVYDLCCYYSETGWENRAYTWEDIVEWRELNE